MRKHIYCDYQTEDNNYNFECHRSATRDWDRESEDPCVGCSHHCDKIINVSSPLYDDYNTEMR